MKKATALIFIFYGIFLLSLSYAKASTFEVHLYYSPSNQTLNFDKLAQKKITLDEEKFVSVFDFADESNKGDFMVKIYDDKEQELIGGYFNPQPGSFVLDVPYVSIATSLKIFSSGKKTEVLKADISEYLTCNSNGTCEFEKGENVDTCIVDCASGNIKFSPETKALLDKNNGLIRDKKTGAVLLKGNIAEKQTINEDEQNSSSNPNNRMWSIILIVVMSAIVIVVIYFIVRRKIIKR